jgi:hypothetical protein
MLHRCQPVGLFFRQQYEMKRHTFHIGIAAAIFGAVIWISVSMSEQYQITVSSPLTIDGIPEGFALCTSVPSRLQLKLRGDGWRLAALMLGPETHLTLPLRRFPIGKRVSLLNEVADHLALRPGVQLVESTPDTLLLELDRLTHKKVPIDVDCSLGFGDGYGQVGTVSVTPESVTIAGAESVLRTVLTWQTERRTFENLRATLETDVPLEQSALYLISVSPRTAHIHVGVEPFAEKVFSGLPVEIRLMPPNREVILIPPRIELVARAGIKQLSSLSAADFHVTADYATILSDTTGAVDPQIAAPPGVQIVRKRPERLTYIIRKPL